MSTSSRSSSCCPTGGESPEMEEPQTREHGHFAYHLVLDVAAQDFSQFEAVYRQNGPWLRIVHDTGIPADERKALATGWFEVYKVDSTDHYSIIPRHTQVLGMPEDERPAQRDVVLIFPNKPNYYKDGVIWEKRGPSRDRHIVQSKQSIGGHERWKRRCVVNHDQPQMMISYSNASTIELKARSSRCVSPYPQAPSLGVPHSVPTCFPSPEITSYPPPRPPIHMSHAPSSRLSGKYDSNPSCAGSRPTSRQGRYDPVRGLVIPFG